MRALKIFTLLIFTLWLSSCADTRFYLQSVGGHLLMMQASRPVVQWLADEGIAPDLKQRLALAQRIRRFAVADLQLPDNASYERYADLQRRAVVWNVVAAPEFSLKLKTWCFPVAGCVGYRGYFSEAEARAEANHQRLEGLEASVYGVPAYSTLGWLNWAGGDPLLNTFIHYPEGELARMIFHELAHQVLYVKGDTVFNESFATAVERLGGTRWLAVHGSPTAKKEYAEFDARRRQLRALSLATRTRLADIYKQNEASALDKQALLAMKNRAMQDFGIAMPASSRPGAATPVTTPGWPGPIMPRLAPKPRMTNWCPRSRPCSSAKTGTGSAFMMRSGNSHNCRQPSGREPSNNYRRSNQVADLHILRQHALGLHEARKIAFAWAEHAEEEFGMTCTYEEGKTADEVSFARSGVHGTLSVTKDQFELTAKLGFLVGAFKARIESEIVKNLDDLLHPKPAGKRAAAKKK